MPETRVYLFLFLVSRYSLKPQVSIPGKSLPNKTSREDCRFATLAMPTVSLRNWISNFKLLPVVQTVPLDLTYGKSQGFYFPKFCKNVRKSVKVRV